MKYIIVECCEIEMAILFDEILNHCDVAKPFKKVISAGKCNTKGEAYGRSVSMSLASRPEDTAIILDSMHRTI